MAATSTASSHQLHKKPTPRRRRFKQTTTTTPAVVHNRHHHPSVVSPNNNSWCCPSAVSSSKPPHAPPPTATSISTALSPSPESFSSEFKLPKTRSLSKMTNTSTVYGGSGNHPETFSPSFTEFNSALTAGLLNPMSPPPPPPINDKTRSSPTLFEMMANEPEKIPINSIPKRPNPNSVIQPPIIIDRQALMHQRLSDLLSCRSPGNRFNDPTSSDVKLTLSSKDGLTVSMNVHKQILVAHSRFFAVKLSDNRWKGDQQQKGLIDNNNHNHNKPYIVEISDCDDIEVYIESIRLMYCKDLRRKLMKDDVPKVLGILKVSAAIGFDAGVLSCLEYLEAAPWAEDEEEKISSLLSELRLEEGVVAIDVLKRVSIDEGNDKEEVIFKLLHVVLEGKNEKSRREMKALVSKMLRENSSQNDLSKESLYSACEKCLCLLRNHFLKASKGDLQNVSQVTRECDNLYWLLDILIDRQLGDDFLKLWASQKELADVHSKVSPIHRHEISRVTARLLVGIGKGQLLTSKDSRCLLLETWLVPFYNDFAWMRRTSKGLDRHLIENALSNTILTLPLTCQQEIMVSWFDRFLNSGDDCPNLQRGFEVWWRRAFCKTIRHVNTHNS